MLARAGDCFRLSTQARGRYRYGSAAFLAFVNDRGIVPRILIMGRSEQTNVNFPREAFLYEWEDNRYDCPVGKPLPFRDANRRASLSHYRAQSIVANLCCYSENNISSKAVIEIKLFIFVGTYANCSIQYEH